MARPTPVARDMGSRREPRGRRKDASLSGKLKLR